MEVNWSRSIEEHPASVVCSAIVEEPVVQSVGDLLAARDSVLIDAGARARSYLEHWGNYATGIMLWSRNGQPSPAYSDSVR